jgi:hypothetical protein
VVELGSDGSAASGGKSDLSEWQRSIKSRISLSPKILSGTATGRLIGFRCCHLREVFLGGFALNFKEMPKFRRIVFLVGIFSFLAGTILTFLDVIGPLHDIDWLKDILDCTFWLSIGITFWKKEMIFSIICFALFGLNLYLSFR